MNDIVNQFQRLAMISELAKRTPEAFGRTALMKYLFFLKVFKDVPLPYSFRLYTYGPFDSGVLDDLQYAESLGAVKSNVVHFPGGYGYVIKDAENAGGIVEKVSDFIASQEENIDWVIDEFGEYSALSLEMISTLVFIDRSLAEERATASISELSEMVHNVKPHLNLDDIEKEAENLKKKGYLLTN